MLGTQGLLNLVRTLDTSDPTQVTTRLLASVEQRCGQQLCDDDVTVLLFRPNGLAPNTPIKERLLAPFRVLRSWAFPELTLANVGGAMIPALNRFWTRQRERQGVVDER